MRVKNNNNNNKNNNNNINNNNNDNNNNNNNNNDLCYNCGSLSYQHYYVSHSLEIFANITHIRSKLLQHIRASFSQQQSAAGCC